MGRKFIDKKKSVTYSVHPRAPDDPLYYDHEAPQAVFYKQDTSKTKHTEDRDTDDSDQTLKRQQQALYGIHFTDNYDYMQHLRTMEDSPSSVFISKDGKRHKAPAPVQKEDPDLPAELLPSEEKIELQPQSDYRGLQPNMDPRLREVLEALDDEAYVEDQDGDAEDFFSELIGEGEATSKSEWIENAPKEELVRKEGEQDWEFEFRKFQLSKTSAGGSQFHEGDSDSDFGSDFGGEAGSLCDEELNGNGTTPVVDSQPKVDAIQTKSKSQSTRRRIGAKTDLTSFSMTSASNFRNAGLTLLDDRFTTVEEEYNESNEESEQEFDFSRERQDLNSIMDDFLNNFEVDGRKLYKKA